MSESFIQVQMRKPGPRGGHMQQRCWIKPVDDKGNPVKPGCTVEIDGDDDSAGVWVVLAKTSDRSVTRDEIPEGRDGNKAETFRVISA